MKKIVLSISFFLFAISLSAQNIYVDGINGNDDNAGNDEKPLRTLQHAVKVANELTGLGSITISMKPGIYLLQDKLLINPVRLLSDTARLTITAAIMPDDISWTPEKMPVIQSVSTNNSDTQFPHATGMLIAGNHVSIKGLKFVGNANPSILYYYPISRENPDLKDLEVSQCYFIGEKYSAIIQGAIWAHGQDLTIKHNIFKSCRNAILAFQNINGCSITNNIIYDAYESAMWIGENVPDFEFSNNVISTCDFVWTKAFEGQQTYSLNNSVIVNNNHYVGRWDREKYGLVEIASHDLKENQVKKKGDVQFITREKAELPKAYLHLKPNSLGYKLNAGIFKR